MRRSLYCLLVAGWGCGVGFTSGEETAGGGAGVGGEGLGEVTTSGPGQGGGATTATGGSGTGGGSAGGATVGGGGDAAQGGSGGAAAMCAGDELTFSGHCYVLSQSPLIWDEARDACTARGAGWGLATVTTQPELDFIVSVMSADLFIGATDHAVEGTYVWLTGAAWGFAPWGGSDPSGSTSQNCLGINVGDGLFHDHACNSPDHYICEWIPIGEPPS